jgi:hypothetical protein
MNVWLCRASAEAPPEANAAVTSRKQMPTEAMQVIDALLVTVTLYQYGIALFLGRY